MGDTITVRPIGIIHSPCRQPQDAPIQGVFRPEVTARAEIYDRYRKGLRDIGGFSHLILVYHFNRAHEERLVTRPFLEDVPHGIFAVRSPFRPNRLGVSIVKLRSVHPDGFVFSEADILDGTPLLDVKPYVSWYDARENVKNGWIDKHFAGGVPPGRGEP